MQPDKSQQLAICARLNVEPEIPPPGEKLGIALATIDLQPLNGFRHPPEEGTSGWFIWGGVEFSDDSDFFEPLHVSHMSSQCPAAIPYLALPPGWRFLVAPDFEDIWFDSSLLVI
jgi:hypothetical protein